MDARPLSPPHWMPPCVPQFAEGLRRAMGGAGTSESRLYFVKAARSASRMVCSHSGNAIQL